MTAPDIIDSKYELPEDSIVLITGATGFTGLHLVRKLAGQRVRIRAIVRSDAAARKLAPYDVECFPGELTDQDVVERATRGVDYIFHMATPYRVAKALGNEHYDVHVTATKLLAKAASKEPGFKRFVHVSTIGVHGHIEDPPADETYRFSPGDDYQETKLEGEQWIHSFAASSGLPYVVVRPAAIYGPGDMRLKKLFRMATLPIVPLIGTDSGLYHLVHVLDLTDFFILAATHPAALGEVFICGSRKPILVADIIREAASFYGARNRFVRIPAGPVMAVAALCEKICVPLGINPPIYPRRVAFFTKDRAFDTSKMTRMLGFTPAIEDKDGIIATARWYADQGLIHRTRKSES